VHEFNPLEDHPGRTKGPEAAPLVKLPLPLRLDNKETPLGALRKAGIDAGQRQSMVSD